MFFCSIVHFIPPSSGTFSLTICLFKMRPYQNSFNLCHPRRSTFTTIRNRLQLEFYLFRVKFSKTLSGKGETSGFELSQMFKGLYNSALFLFYPHFVVKRISTFGTFPVSLILTLLPPV